MAVTTAAALGIAGIMGASTVASAALSRPRSQSQALPEAPDPAKAEAEARKKSKLATKRRTESSTLLSSGAVEENVEKKTLLG